LGSQSSLHMGENVDSSKKRSRINFHLRGCLIPDYHKLDDNSLVERAQIGDEGAQSFLINKYEYLVHLKARPYFLNGADREDILQEGMIGLYKAIKGYRKNGFCSFCSFALLCINRQLISAIKTSTRKKHLPLNSYTSLTTNVFDEENKSTLLDATPSMRADDPLNLFILGEEIRRIKKVLKKILSNLEWRVLESHVEGKSYKEIAEELESHIKVVDNALCRIKLKLKGIK